MYKSWVFCVRLNPSPPCSFPLKATRRNLKWNTRYPLILLLRAHVLFVVGERVGVSGHPSVLHSLMYAVHLPHWGDDKGMCRGGRKDYRSRKTFSRCKKSHWLCNFLVDLLASYTASCVLAGPQITSTTCCTPEVSVSFIMAVPRRGNGPQCYGCQTFLWSVCCAKGYSYPIFDFPSTVISPSWYL